MAATWSSQQDNWKEPAKFLCVGNLMDPHFPDFLLDHPAGTDLHKEKKIKSHFLSFPWGGCLQLCSKMSFTRTLWICREEKKPFGGMKEHMGWGISSSWRHHQFLMALSFWGKGWMVLLWQLRNFRDIFHPVHDKYASPVKPGLFVTAALTATSKFELLAWAWFRTF